MAFDSPRRRPCGTWPSPITAQAVTEPVTTVDDVIVDPVTRRYYHTEIRPLFNSRHVLVDSERGEDIVDEHFDVKTVINNYGTQAAASIRDNVLYFNNANDHRVYRQSLPSMRAIPITPASVPFRFAFFVRHPVQTNIIFTVKEDRTNPSAVGIVTTLAYIDARKAQVHELVSGSDFYLSPSVNAAGTKLAWLEWNHPHMQWTGAQLYIADIVIHGNDAVYLTNRQLIAGDPGQNAVSQFTWCPPDYNSNIFFAWDKTSFCEPWLYLPDGHGTQRLKNIFSQPNSLQCDFADPSWFPDECSFVFMDDRNLMLWVTTKEGRSHLNFLKLYPGESPTGELQPILPDPYVEIKRVRRIDENTVVFIGTEAKRSASVIRMTIDRAWAFPAPTFHNMFSPPETPVESGMIPIPQSYKIPKRNGHFTYAHFYPPTNSTFAPPENEKPPCILSLHSGPTIRSQVGFQLTRTYFTSRGFAWLDVDFCGSTGYGKEYRSRLDGQYGVLDIEDVLAASEYLAFAGHFDRSRVGLRACGSGCFPVLQILTKYPESYVGAATHEMVVDPTAAARENIDKLTRYYLSSLMGGRPEEIPAVYEHRNPVLHADKIVRPLLVTHWQTGGQSPQAKQIVETLLENNRTVTYEFFPRSIKEEVMHARSLELELAFFQRILT